MCCALKVVGRSDCRHRGSEGRAGSRARHLAARQRWNRPLTKFLILHSWDQSTPDPLSGNYGATRCFDSVQPMARRIMVAISCTSVALAMSVSACADPPPKFPDLNGFVAADANQYTRPGRQWSGYLFFTTLSGVNCQIVSTVVCGGNIPGIPSGSVGHDGQGCGRVTKGGSSSSGPESYKLSSHDGQCPPFADTILNAGQKLSIGDGKTSATCAVADGDVTACVDYWKHGFVLRPEGSWTF